MCNGQAKPENGLMLNRSDLSWLQPEMARFLGDMTLFDSLIRTAVFNISLTITIFLKCYHRIINLEYMFIKL